VAKADATLRRWLNVALLSMETSGFVEGTYRQIAARVRIRKADLRRPLNDVAVHLIASRQPPIGHAANVTPGLTWHKFLSSFAEPDNSFTHLLDTALDSVTRPLVLLEGQATRPGPAAGAKRRPSRY
jgi:hypothetical protein